MSAPPVRSIPRPEPSSPRLTGDLPRDWTREVYRFFSWWTRKTWRDNKDEIMKAVTDQILYGNGYMRLNGEYAEHVPVGLVQAMEKASDQPNGDVP